MRAWCLIVALMAAGPVLTAQERAAWHADVSAGPFIEAWDRNQWREALVTAAIGLDRRVWRGLSVRIEGLGARVSQRGDDAWLAGFTVGSRLRGRPARCQPFGDLAVGLSKASTPTPPRGTSFNYLAVATGGVAVATGLGSVELGARWLHISNAGREGNGRNPDIQALGLTAGIGWRW